MRWFQNTYTRRLNTQHRDWGRFFGDRYKAVLTEGRTGYYYCTLMDYIHLNPARARLVNVQEGQSVMDYEWSSVPSGYARMERDRPPWLAVAEGLSAFGFPDTAAGRRKFVAHLDERAREEEAERWGVPELPEDSRLSHLRRGWYWGSRVPRTSANYSDAPRMGGELPNRT